MNPPDITCIMPPEPGAQDKIHRAKKRMLMGEALPERAASDSDTLDSRTFTIIASRPSKTRPDTLVSRTQQLASITGTRRPLVLLVDFTDLPSTRPQAEIGDMLFSSGTYPTGSMRDFYQEASYGTLDVNGTVFPTGGWYRAPDLKTHYTDNNFGIYGTYPNNAQKLVEDAIDLADADPSVNFADFDADGDGAVDALVVIAAGVGGEQSLNTSDFWSHKRDISSPKTVNGVQVHKFFIAPENGRVGVMAHELGHLLMGWPDLYDTDYSSRGTGKWDLMAGGSWNGSPRGDTPAHPVAYLKARAGWVNPVTIFDASQTASIPPYATNDKVYKLPIGSSTSKEYFLLSNRQKTGFDTDMPGDGLIIEHVDENQANNTDESHYLVDVEQSDGNRDLNNDTNSGDATDPYPSPATDTFTGTSTPNSNSYGGASSNVAVVNIARSGTNITADISVGAVTGWHYNKKVLMTYAHHTSHAAWANVESVGWRRIKEGAPDGVTNIFDVCCQAAAKGRNVHVYADKDFIHTIYLV